MKIIRSLVPTIIGDRKKREAFVAIGITEWTYQELPRRYKAEVTDYEVIDVPNPKAGDPLKRYVPINNETRYRTELEIDQLFTALGIPIGVNDSFASKNRNLIVKGLLIDTQQNPIYDVAPEQWEIVDTETEVAPIPEPEPEPEV